MSTTEVEQNIIENVNLVNSQQQQQEQQQIPGDNNSAFIKNGPSIPRTPDNNSKSIKFEIKGEDVVSDTQTIITNLSITDSVNNNNDNDLKPVDKIQKNELVEFHFSDEEMGVGSVEQEAGCGESDAHLPRVRVELDRLNYANESINNLELELVEAKREFLEVLRFSENELERCEKKIGNQHVMKSMAYYEERLALNLTKQKYLNAKFRFETAQELYVAAKNVQMYAEENLEDAKDLSMSGNAGSVTENMNLMKMHKMAKVKVSEAEFSKQSCDLEQIESFKVYELSLKRVEQLEKRFKSSISKSLKYFQMKSSYNKELQFFALKIDGLKSCLREAKTAYQQSLKNLEKISTEVHLQRSFSSNKAAEAQKSISPNSSISTISSTNATNSLSSPNLATMTAQQADEMAAHKLRSRSNSLSTLTEASNKHARNVRDDIERGQSTETEEEEDYDKIFNDSILKSESERSFAKTVHYSQKLDKNAVCLLTDEEIESLRLDKKIRKCEGELIGRKTIDLETRNTSDKSNTSSGVESSSAPAVVVVVDSRPQFRVPFFSKTPLFQP